MNSLSRLDLPHHWQQSEEDGDGEVDEELAMGIGGFATTLELALQEVHAIEFAIGLLF